MARWILFCWLALLPGIAGAAAFIVGIHPIHSMHVLAERYEPLRAYLEARLERPVYLESAPDFAEYHARTLRGDFDLAITPAHFGRIAQKDRGFHPLIQFQPDNDALLVCSMDRPLSNPDLMKQQQLAVIDPLAVTVMAVTHHLRAHGLESGRDYTVVPYHNHAGVARALVAGLAMAGVTTTHGMKQIPDALRGKLQVVMRLADIPAFVALAKPEASREESARLREMLLAFARGRTGQDFLKANGFTGFVPAEEKQLKRVDAYLKETRKGLAP